MTPAELVLWERVRNSQIRGLRFRRQQAIDGYIADFFCYQARLIIEVDGEAHAQQIEYDAVRDAQLAFGGYRVLRFTNTQVVEQIEWVLELINRVVVERTCQARK